MCDERRDLIAAYRATPVTLGFLLRGLDDAAAAVRPSDEEWSVSEAVCHLLDSEQRTYERVLRIRDEERPTLPLFPDDEYRGRSLSRALGSFGALRLAHVRLLDELEPTSWYRGGIHEAAGEVSILDIVRHNVAHDAEHLAQIARATTAT